MKIFDIFKSNEVKLKELEGEIKVAEEELRISKIQFESINEMRQWDNTDHKQFLSDTYDACKARLDLLNATRVRLQKKISSN